MIFLLASLLMAGDPSQTFPQIRVPDLNGKVVTLPDDLTGGHRLILIGYERNQQESLDRWIDSAVRLNRPEGTLGIYELPIIDDPGRIGRGMIDAGMKLAIRDEATRARVLTLYTDKAAMMRTLRLKSDRTVDLLLLAGDGTIVWRESGPVTADKLASLLTAIAADSDAGDE